MWAALCQRGVCLVSPTVVPPAVAFSYSFLVSVGLMFALFFHLFSEDVLAFQLRFKVLSTPQHVPSFGCWGCCVPGAAPASIWGSAVGLQVFSCSVCAHVDVEGVLHNFLRKGTREVQVLGQNSDLRRCPHPHPWAQWEMGPHQSKGAMQLGKRAEMGGVS